MNSSGFVEEKKNLIEKIALPTKDQIHDITYRISFPFDFDDKFNSKLLFVYGICEYKFVNETYYKNNTPDTLKKNKNLFIHTPTQWTKGGFINSGFSESQIIVVNHGIDQDTFYIISDERKEDVRKKYGFKSDDFILTNIGAMTANKGVELLIAAYGILKKENKNLKLILKDQSNLYGIGTNHLFKKLLNSELNKKFKAINDDMMKDITIISENLTQSEIRELYSISDCYVSPYFAEGFNLPPLEAAACGTRILVTKGGATDDYFDNCMGYQIEGVEKKTNNLHVVEPRFDSLINVLKDKVINKPDHLKKERSDFTHKNNSWAIVVNKLNEEFKNKLR
jgi:glycosyltransferase involved in cell wall biosynthesis